MKQKQEQKNLCGWNHRNAGFESSVSSAGLLNDIRGWTHKFIFLPMIFQLQSMITNFHTPKSTLLMMVSAFADPISLNTHISLPLKRNIILLLWRCNVGYIKDKIVVLRIFYK